MKLAEAIARLESFDDELALFARKPWTAESDVELVALDEDGAVPDALAASLRQRGFAYFLEVDLACELITGIRGNPRFEPRRFELILYYAENDAYPGWLA